MAFRNNISCPTLQMPLLPTCRRITHHGAPQLARPPQLLHTNEHSPHLQTALPCCQLPPPLRSRPKKPKCSPSVGAPTVVVWPRLLLTNSTPICGKDTLLGADLAVMAAPIFSTEPLLLNIIRYNSPPRNEFIVAASVSLGCREVLAEKVLLLRLLRVLVIGIWASHE